MVPFTSSRPGRFIWYKSLNVATEPVFVLNVAFNFTGPLNFSCPRCHIERVQAMNKGSVLVCLAITYRVLVLGSMTGVDTMPSSVNAVTPRAPLHRPWHCGDSCRRIDKTNLPKWLRVDARIVVCIKRGSRHSCSECCCRRYSADTCTDVIHAGGRRCGVGHRRVPRCVAGGWHCREAAARAPI